MAARQKHFTAGLEDMKGPKFKVLHSTKKSQAAVMKLKPGEEAGKPDTHTGDQWFAAYEGEAVVLLWESGVSKDPTQVEVKQGSILLIPGGTQHHVRGAGSKPFVAFTFYAPPAY